MQPDQAADYVAGILTRNKVNFGTSDDGHVHRVLYGSTAVLVNFAPWGQDDSVVNIVASVLEDLDKKAAPKALERINKLNCDGYFGKFCLYDGSLRVEHDLLASRLQAEEFMNALGVLATCADEVDDELQCEIGGKTWEQAANEDTEQQESVET